VRNFATLPGSRVVALCDADPERLRRSAAQVPGARACPRFEEIVGMPEVQAAVVAAPAVEHYPIARALLEADKDVYVEKPLALQTAHAEELVALARERNRILMVGHLLLFHPGVRHLKEMVQGGELGDLYYLYAQRVNLGKVRRDENALWSFAPHDLSVILHLLEAEPIDVAARGSAYLQRSVEDVVFLHLRFADERMAHVHVSWLDPHKLRKLTVVGSRRMVVFDDMEASEKIRVYDKGVDPSGRFVNYGDALSVRSGDILIPKISLQEPLRIECQHFIECVRERRTPLADGANGLAVVRVLAAAQASLDAGGAPVPLSAGRPLAGAAGVR
jgi:predicted dehydrogenase